jgi:hypothetical protein
MDETKKLSMLRPLSTIQISKKMKIQISKKSLRVNTVDNILLSTIQISKKMKIQKI